MCLWKQSFQLGENVYGGEYFCCRLPTVNAVVAHHRDNWGGNASQVSAAKGQEARTQWLVLHSVIWIKHGQTIIMLKSRIPGLFQKWLMSMEATAFRLDHELTHRKLYSSEKSNPLTSPVKQHKQGDQRHSMLLKTLLPALVAVPFTRVEASPYQPCTYLGQTLSSDWPTDSCMGQPPPAAKEDIWCGISQPCKSSVSSLGYKIL